MAGASALGVVAVLLWALTTLVIFLIALANGMLHPVTW